MTTSPCDTPDRTGAGSDLGADGWNAVAALLALGGGKGTVNIVDGGCHVGRFSGFARQTWPDSRIRAFEPDPDNYLVCKAKFDKSAGITVLNAALGAKAGRAEFFRGERSATNSLLPRPDATGRPYYPEQATLKGGEYVDVVTLDEVLDQHDFGSLDLLKLDLQGGEMAALRGAARLLQRQAVRIVVCEVVFVRKYENQPLFWDLAAFLEQKGYSFHSLFDVKIGTYDKSDGTPRDTQWNQADAVFLSMDMRERLDT